MRPRGFPPELAPSEPAPPGLSPAHPGAGWRFAVRYGTVLAMSDRTALDAR
jgi:hypothetical protein